MVLTEFGLTFAPADALQREETFRPTVHSTRTRLSAPVNSTTPTAHGILFRK
jgi:hypothetical protein